jgi:hypothetical protein
MQQVNSSAQLLLGHKRNDLVLGSALSFFGRRKNCPDIEAVPGGLLLANVADFIDDGISGQFLFSQGECSGDRGNSNMHAIPDYQENHAVHASNSDGRRREAPPIFRRKRAND